MASRTKLWVPSGDEGRLLPERRCRMPSFLRFTRRSFIPLVRRATWRHRLSKEDARDVVQDAFLLAIEKIDAAGNPKAWLIQVVDHLGHEPTSGSRSDELNLLSKVDSEVQDATRSSGRIRPTGGPRPLTSLSRQLSAVVQADQVDMAPIGHLLMRAASWRDRSWAPILSGESPSRRSCRRLRPFQTFSTRSVPASGCRTGLRAAIHETAGLSLSTRLWNFRGGRIPRRRRMEPALCSVRIRRVGRSRGANGDYVNDESLGTRLREDMYSTGMSFASFLVFRIQDRDVGLIDRFLRSPEDVLVACRWQRYDANANPLLVAQFRSMSR